MSVSDGTIACAKITVCLSAMEFDIGACIPRIHTGFFVRGATGIV